MRRNEKQHQEGLGGYSVSACLAVLFAEIFVEQAGAELGQAQIKLGLGFTSINLHYINNQEMLLARLTATNEHK